MYKILIETNHSLSKRWRYTLGEKIENTALNLLEQLIISQQAPGPLKGTWLLKSNATLEVLRLQIRLLLELDLVNETKIFQLNSMMSDIGRMLGGWMKYSKSPSK